MALRNLNFVGALCCCLGMFLLLGCANAHENITFPMANVNLDPNQQMRNVYFCLMYRSAAGQCADKGVNRGILTPQGKLNVSSEELEEFCSPGNCADNIRHNVLDCIHLVHRRFLFANNVSVDYINKSINAACAEKSSGLVIVGVPKSSGVNAYHKKYVSIVSGLFGLLVIFNNIM